MRNKIKTLAAFALIAISCNSIQAQTATSQFGVKGGVNFSNIYAKDVDDDNVLTSFNAGIYAAFPVGDILSIQPEILYSRKGSKLTYNNNTSEFRLNYIEIPILAKVNVTDELSIHAGPYFAYLVDAQAKTNNNNPTTYNNDNFNKFDGGIAAGLAYDFGIVGIGARYSYGLSTIGKERTFLGVTTTVPDGKNSSISLYATIKLK